MIHSLRKGCTSVYLKHPHTGHSIGAEKYESEVEAEVAILRFTLRPVDRNQKFDEEYLHNNVLEYVDIDDATVITGLGNHVKSHRQEVTSWKLQIISRGKTFRFEVTPSILQHGALHLRVLSASTQGSSLDITLSLLPLDLLRTRLR